MVSSVWNSRSFIVSARSSGMLYAFRSTFLTNLNRFAWGLSSLSIDRSLSLFLSAWREISDFSEDVLLSRSGLRPGVGGTSSIEVSLDRDLLFLTGEMDSLIWRGRRFCLLSLDLPLLFLREASIRSAPSSDSTWFWSVAPFRSACWSSLGAVAPIRSACPSFCLFLAVAPLWSACSLFDSVAPFRSAWSFLYSVAFFVLAI